MLNSTHFCRVLDHWKDRQSAWPTHSSAHPAAVVLVAGAAMPHALDGRNPTVAGLNPSSVSTAHGAAWYANIVFWSVQASKMAFLAQSESAGVDPPIWPNTFFQQNRVSFLQCFEHKQLATFVTSHELND